MKTILITSLLTVVFVAKLFAALPLENQPECLGMKWRSVIVNGFPQENFVYGTLFEPSRKYFVSCSHWHPEAGDVLTFGKNGATGTVKSITLIRAGSTYGEYELSIGEFEEPVNAVPAETWWYKPPNLVEGSCVEGFAGTSEYSYGKFTGTANEIYGESESGRGWKYQSSDAPGGGFQNGFSGCPIFFQGKLLGAHWGNSSFTVGQANPIYMVFADYWSSTAFQQFGFTQPPEMAFMTISPLPCNKMQLILKRRPGMTGEMDFSNDLNNWFPIESSTELESFEYEETTPWTTKAIVSVSSSKTFFRGK